MPEDASENPVAPAQAAPEDGGGGAKRERCGPLELERQRKDDGRALILYSHSGERAP